MDFDFLLVTRTGITDTTRQPSCNNKRDNKATTTKEAAKTVDSAINLINVTLMTAQCDYVGNCNVNDDTCDAVEAAGRADAL